MEKRNNGEWYLRKEEDLSGGNRIQSARILPLKLKQNDLFTISLSGFNSYAGERAKITIEIVDVALSYFREVEGEFDCDGELTLRINRGFDTIRPCSVYVGRIEARGEIVRISDNPASLLNIEFDDRDPSLAQQIHRSIFEQHRSLYAQSVGEPLPDSMQHRSFCLVEGVDVANEISLGAGRVIPVPSRVPDLERHGLLNDLLSSFKVSTRVPEIEWQRNAEHQSSMVFIVFPKVFAPDFDNAQRLTREALVPILGTLAVHRVAPPNAVSIVIEQRQQDDTVSSLVFPPDGTWLGTPVPEFEPVLDLQAIHDVIAGDNFLRLCVEQFRIAMQQRDSDIKFLHFFSVLELLGRRSHPQASKRLIDGSPWPYPAKGVDPAPNIYDSIAEMLKKMNRPESSTAFPATDLYEAVQSWKGRRNATTHYGGFDPAHAEQKKQPWFEAAKKTLINEYGWERGLILVVTRLLRFEIEKARLTKSTI